MLEKWKKFFRDPSFWWDNRLLNKKNKSRPDFKHVSTGEGLWIADTKTPAWVSAKLESLADPSVGNTTARYKSPHTSPEAEAADNPVSLGRLIKESAKSRCLSMGKQAHEAVLKSDEHKSNIYLLTGLIDMYCKCGQLAEARKIFDSMGSRNVVSYNAIIQGCASNGQAELAVEYYSALRADSTVQPNNRTHVAVTRACSRLVTESSEKRERALRIGMEIHSMLSKEKKQEDLFVATGLVDLYCKCGEIEEARKAFDSMGTRDSVSYCTIIQGCASNGQAELALEYYSALRADKTIQPDDWTHAAVISACSRLATESSEKRERALRIGMEIHSMLSKEKKQMDLFLATCFVDMYCKCGELEEARKIFNSMKTRDSVSYCTIIQGCGSNGQAELVLEYYYSALRADTTIQLDACTYNCILVACGSVMSIELGRKIHQLVKEKELLENNPVLASSLVSFYGKCGDVASAQEAFDECRARDDTGLWNSLIQAYTLQGRSTEALELFYSMTQEEGCRANDVTFVTVLNACSHVGLVEKGRQLLDEMPKQYGVEPCLDHYVCLIDMLGRANLLDEALRVLKTMPFEPDAVVWRSLLGACRKSKNHTIGQLAFDRLVEMDPKNGVPYVLMANIFGNLGMLGERAGVVERMSDEDSMRTAGRSWWTDASGKVHSFTVGDRSHSQSDEIAAKLTELSLRMKEEGYVSDVINVLKDTPEEEKEDHLCGHSEKLALACALVNSRQKETIRIVKNLRVCDDCHEATALISKLEKRRIICRDASRVHVFQDGICSCDNYF